MRSAFVALLIFGSGLLLGNEIPDLIYGKNPYRKTPIWVSRSAATTAKGQLREELFESHDLHHIREVTKQRLCFGESLTEAHARRDTLTAMVQNASIILDGKIVEVGPGFFFGSPGSLLRIATGEGKFALIYYPSARFRIGRDVLCAVPAFPSASPRVGVRVLAFVFAPPLDRDESFFLTRSRDILVETARGKLVVPQGWAGDRSLQSADFEELRRRVRTLRPELNVVKE